MKIFFLVIATAVCATSFTQRKFYPILYTDTNKVHEHVENEVQYPGGETAMKDFIRKNVKYPENARMYMVQGDVVIAADVDVRGQLSNAKVKGSVHPDLDKEALRLVNAFPKLKPATISGGPVRALATFKIQFIHPDAGSKIPVTATKFEEEDEEVIMTEIKADIPESKTNTQVVEEPKVFTFVEQPPSFPNGDEALMDTIKRNIVYPAFGEGE